MVVSIFPDEPPSVDFRQEDKGNDQQQLQININKYYKVYKQVYFLYIKVGRGFTP